MARGARETRVSGYPRVAGRYRYFLREQYVGINIHVPLDGNQVAQIGIFSSASARAATIRTQKRSLMMVVDEESGRHGRVRGRERKNRQMLRCRKTNIPHESAIKPS
jgi:hypothetical protein